ncbi:Hypothetical predicted protein, partial [Paramuricea clavata]
NEVPEEKVTLLKGEEKEDKKKDGNGEQKIQNEIPSNNSKFAHANGEGSEPDRKVEDNEKAKTAGNGKNSEEEPVNFKKGKTQKSDTDNTGESNEDGESGDEGTRPTTDGQDKTPNPQQSGGNQIFVKHYLEIS